MVRKELSMITKMALRGWRVLSRTFMRRGRLFLAMMRSIKTCTKKTRGLNRTKERKKVKKNMIFGGKRRNGKTRSFSGRRSLMTLMSSLISRGNREKKE